MDKILIRGLKVLACHGCKDFEKTAPQPFIFDADLYFDFSRAAKTDNLSDTINYSAASKIIAAVAQNNTYNLIEKLAYECACAVLDGTPASGISLTVYKPEAPVKLDFNSMGATVELWRTTAYLSLGSSVGNREEYLRAAIEKLNTFRGITVKKVSGFIETEPYGGVAKNKFINCAAEVETYLTARGLLNAVHAVENACGRTRTVRWEDRTLDIDIIFFGKQVITEDDLIIPHPAYATRGFVLEPLKQIAPDFVCPVLKKPVKAIKI